jgi:hypothetical protein
MRFFTISFDYFPGDEGDEWQSVTRSICPSCGLRVAQFADRFPTRDDDVETPSLYLDDAETPSFFQIGGLYFVTDNMKLAITTFLDSQHFKFEPVNIENNANSSLHWMRISGRLETKPVYFGLGRPCDECGISTQRKIQPRPPLARYVVKRSTISGRYLYAVPEYSAPDIVDEEFKVFLETTDKSIGDTISFREVVVE